MSDPFQEIDVADAQSFLQSFPSATRQRGENYLHDGRVRSLEARKAGRAYVATVQGSELYTVELAYSRNKGWTAACSCPMQSDCKHCYAALKTLLAEHSVSAVRQISARATLIPPDPVPKTTAPSLDARPLAEIAASALGRPLTSKEAKLCQTISAAYARSSSGLPLSYWDWQQMGLSVPAQGWNTTKIYPTPPRTEHEFWLYVAYAAHENSVEIPNFLAPISDFSAIEDVVIRWRRKQEVDRWKNTLSYQLSSGGQEGSVIPPETADVRLVMHAQEARLEWKKSTDQEFVPLKASHLKSLPEDCASGWRWLPAEAELLCQLVTSRYSYNSSSSSNLQYRDYNAVPVLNRILRNPSLSSRVVNTAGIPLKRVESPLRWDLEPAPDGDGDYRLRLVQAEGTPLPEIILILHGHPNLLVSKDAIFQAPVLHQHVLEPAKENLIPAAALETRQGVSFLSALGVQMPERLQAKIQHVAMHVVISCHLQPVYPGSASEHCVFEITAEAEDGQSTETWNGEHWVADHKRQRSAKSRKAEKKITLYDRSNLKNITALLQPLGLRSSPYWQVLTLRVTKKFPELFATWLKSVPPEIRVELDGELASFQKETVAGQMRLDVSEAAIDWFDLQVIVDVSDTTLTREEIKLLVNAKGGFVRLPQKGWRRLQFNFTEEEDERLAQLGLSPHELTAEPQRLHALQLADESAKKFLPAQQVEQIQRRVSEIKARVTPALPAGIKAELRPYQLSGFHFLAYLSANHFGGILADDMGLGKTLQTLAWLLWLRESSNANSPQPCLVVCPKSVMDNWHAEAERFAPGLRVKSWPASELDKMVGRLSEADLHVINYNQLRILGESLVPVQWQAVVLDEGQYIKNPNSQTAQVARALRAEHRLVLSGTPIENRLLDLWSLMSFAMPGALGSRPQFAKIYDSKIDPLARKRLAARVRPFLMRRTKSQVAKDLPDRIEEDLFCEIESEQKSLYRAELKRAQQRLLKVQTQQQLAKERFHFLTSLLRLRQICCHPKLVKPDSNAASAKMEALLEQLEPLIEEGHKVLVFSQFVELLALLKPEMAQRQWPMFYLAGETENRGQLVKDFQSAEGPAVFLISLKAGGFGLNLTAASYVVLFDPWWNPAVENQAIDRTHRIGQVNKVIAYRLLIKDSIEEKIRTLQKQKSALAQDVLGEEKFAQSLSLSDLQFLFAD